MTAVIDISAARRSRDVIAERPGTSLAARVSVMARSGASVREIDRLIASDLRDRLTVRRSRTSLLAKIS
jgi:hypothetical protein